jgi:hypothetical protein
MDPTPAPTPPTRGSTWILLAQVALVVLVLLAVLLLCGALGINFGPGGPDG